MKIDNKFKIGDYVYLVTDKDQFKRIVTAIQVTQTGLLYRLCLERDESWHYDFEICAEKDIILATSS